MLLSVTLVILAILISLFFVLFTLYTAVVLHSRWKYRKINGPPTESFFLGHLSQIKRMHAEKRYIHDLFLEWAEAYGPITKIFVLHKCLLLPTGQNFLKEIMTKSKYPKATKAYSTLYSVFGSRLLGKGLVCETDYKTWHRRRSVLNPSFRRKFLRGMMEQFNELANDWVDHLSQFADGSTVFSLADMCCCITLDVVGKVVFGVEMRSVEKDNKGLPAVQKVLEGLSMSKKDPLIRLKPHKRGFVKDVQEAACYLRETGKEAIRNRRAALINNEPVPDDVLTMLIQLIEEDPGVTEETVIDDYITFVLAGQETTANALSFIFNEIGRRPHVEQRVREELEEVAGDKPFITYEDVTQLEYMGQVWKETLRMYPPAPGSARDVLEETVIDGITIPANSFIVLPFYVIHRLSQYYEDPHEFIPERFAPGRKRPLYTYMPFSMGQRSCIGQHFAHIEAKVLLSKFLQRFWYKLDPKQSFEIQETATLKPKGGTMVTLTLR